MTANGEIRLEYETNDIDSPSAVVFLHGWGGDIRSFGGAYSALTARGARAYNVAFPKLVPSDWGVYDYAQALREFLSAHNIERPTLVGHSFGGRVAIILASQGVCERLVLVDSAGMKPRFDIRKKIKIARYKYRVKHGKPLDGMGSIDYNNLDVSMRGVFVRIVNSHLERLLPFIECPTLIIWGKCDKDTPPYMARRLHRGIKGSKLEYIDGGHYAYAQSHYAFVRLLVEYLSE